MLFSEPGVRWYSDQLDRCRRVIHEFLSIDKNDSPSHVMFVSNSTTAFQIILSNIELTSGDVVLSSDQEHPGIIRSIARLGTKGVQLQVVGGESEDDFCQNLEDAIFKYNPRLLIVSHVAYTDGRVFPLTRICALAKKKNVIVAIDGAQAIGHIPINMHGIDTDFYFFSGHKWCCGPMGTGVLLVTEKYLTRKPSMRVELLRESNSVQKYFDLGTQHVGNIAGLARACELRKTELPTATICLYKLQEKLLTLVKSLGRVHIRRWKGAHAPGICTLQLEGDRVNPSLLTDYLIQHYGIAIKPFNYPEDPGLIRISYSESTSESDIQTVVDRLADALSTLNRS
ncbi:MAG: aminotransferase class V-fold PLP-dependent enzyme [Nitrospira sp.]|nr:aminotransferase class V-fold PLP-dependent enzyme [Nitrospira sp.]